MGSGRDTLLNVREIPRENDGELGDRPCSETRALFTHACMYGRAIARRRW